MKKIFFIILLLMLTGCQKNMEYDKNYGVRYSIENEGGITIRLDRNNSETVTELWIDNIDGSKSFSVYISDYNDDNSKIEVTPVSYIYDKNCETIVVNFYNPKLRKVDI